MEREKYNETVFESIKKLDESGNEYWEARELQKVLGYAQWRRFEEVINRAKIAYEKSNNLDVDYHFAKVGEIMKTGAYSRKIDDFFLSRYACYLIVQNGGPNKEIIALGQAYFAIQTRKQELIQEAYDLLTEDEKRFYQRLKRV